MADGSYLKYDTIVKSDILNLTKKQLTHDNAHNLCLMLNNTAPKMAL